MNSIKLFDSNLKDLINILIERDAFVDLAQSVGEDSFQFQRGLAVGVYNTLVEQVASSKIDPPDDPVAFRYFILQLMKKNGTHDNLTKYIAEH